MITKECIRLAETKPGMVLVLVPYGKTHKEYIAVPSLPDDDGKENTVTHVNGDPDFLITPYGNARRARLESWARFASSCKIVMRVLPTPSEP